MDTNNKYSVLKNALKIFLPFIVTITALTAYITFVKNNSELVLIRGFEQNSVDLAKEKVEKELHHVISDLSILASLNELEYVLQDFTNMEALRNLEDYFLSLNLNRKVYDQVRLLDNSGMEVIRVNYNHGSPAIVQKKDLQNKKGRYYFDDAFKLERDQVFVSPLDLNIERGEIEIPLKPMIRFATPVFDQNGVKKGIILLNYFGKQVLQISTESNNKFINDHIMIVNSDSYWLKGLIPDQEWGFMYNDRKDINFKNAFPDEWLKMKDEDASQIETTNGLLTFRTVYPIPDELISSTGSDKAFAPSSKKISSQDYFWKIVSFIDHNTYHSKLHMRTRSSALIVLLLAIASFLASWKIAQTNHLRQEANNKLVESEKKLKQINSEKDKFFSIIAHDLKNPFHSIIGFTKLLDKNFDNYNEAKKKNMLIMIQKGLKHTQKLLENLLFWSRSQRGMIELKAERLNLHLVAQNTCNMLSQGAGIKSITLVNNIPLEFFIEADCDILSTIIRNLVSNAIKFTNQGGEVTIDAKYKKTSTGDKYSEITIKDNGIGMSKETQSQLFDIGTNISSSGTEDETGTGLGLILCKEFVEKHGGKIWVKSEINKGSKFYFTIPTKE